MQGTHEKHLREGGLDEFQIERDFKTGLKRVTTVQDKDVTVSGKAYIQDSIDQYRKLLHKGLASLELLQRMEQSFKEKVEDEELNIKAK